MSGGRRTGWRIAHHTCGGGGGGRMRMEICTTYPLTALPPSSFSRRAPEDAKQCDR